MKESIITAFEKKHFKGRDLPSFTTGDTVSVHYRIQDRADSQKTRIQQYEGIVIRYKKGTAESSFTVRKIGAGGIGIERVFPVCSPNIEKLEVKAKGIVRRSRLYYLRGLSGKAARIRSRFGGGVSQGTANEKTSPEASTEEVSSES